MKFMKLMNLQKLEVELKEMNKTCLFCPNPIQGSLWNYNPGTIFTKIETGESIILTTIGMYLVCINHMFTLSLNPQAGQYITVPYGVPN